MNLFKSFVIRLNLIEHPLGRKVRWNTLSSVFNINCRPSGRKLIQACHIWTDFYLSRFVKPTLDSTDIFKT